MSVPEESFLRFQAHVSRAPLELAGDGGGPFPSVLQKIRGIATAFKKVGHLLAFLQEVIILEAKTTKAQELGVGNTIFAVLRMRRGVM